PEQGHQRNLDGNGAREARLSLLPVAGGWLCLQRSGEQDVFWLGARVEWFGGSRSGSRLLLFSKRPARRSPYLQLCLPHDDWSAAGLCLYPARLRRAAAAPLSRSVLAARCGRKRAG